MGWEVWRKTYHYGEFAKFGFFCNTADVGFGPVFHLDCATTGEFYKIWDEVTHKLFERHVDPRSLHHDEIYEIILKIKEARGEEE